MTDDLQRWLGLLAPLLGSSVLLTTVKALVDLRASNSERHMAQREAEVYSKLPHDSAAARALLSLLGTRARRWRARELRRGWLSATVTSLVLVGGGAAYLYFLDSKTVDVSGTWERFILAIDGTAITWNRFDTLVATGTSLVLVGLGWWVVGLFRVALQYGLAEDQDRADRRPTTRPAPSSSPTDAQPEQSKSPEDSSKNDKSEDQPEESGASG